MNGLCAICDTNHHELQDHPFTSPVAHCRDCSLVFATHYAAGTHGALAHHGIKYHDERQGTICRACECEVDADGICGCNPVDA